MTSAIARRPRAKAQTRKRRSSAGISLIEIAAPSAIAAGAPAPFARVRFGKRFPHEKEIPASHRQDHQTVEVRRPGKAVNDERIPGIPGGVRVATRPPISDRSTPIVARSAAAKSSL